MIPAKAEYIRLMKNRLEENRKSFEILLNLKHYGNCISIMCHELDQVIRLLYVLKMQQHEKDLLINQAVNNQKWFLIGKDNKKIPINDSVLLKFAETLDGWERSIYEFGFSFKSISINFNYLVRDPTKSLDEQERTKIQHYIARYHNDAFPRDFSLDDLIPMLSIIFNKLSEKLVEYMMMIEK